MSQYIKSNEAINKDSMWDGAAIGAGIGAVGGLGLGAMTHAMSKSMKADMVAKEASNAKEKERATRILNDEHSTSIEKKGANATLDRIEKSNNSIANSRAIHNVWSGSKLRTAGMYAGHGILASAVLGGIGATIDALHNSNK